MDPYFTKIKKSVLNLCNPHGFLGLHDGHLIYQYSPNKRENSIFMNGEKKEMTLIDQRGYFVYDHVEPLKATDYQIIHTDGSVGADPYSCTPSFSLVDAHLFDRGEHFELYKAFGSHYCIHDELEGVKFAVYAPNALHVHLRCDMGNWREKIYPMRKIGDMGIFELFIPGCKIPMMYKYSIFTKDYKTVLKSDPFGRRFELRPKTATIVHKEKKFIWTDQKWIKDRETDHSFSPMNIYEFHLGAWNKGGIFPNFKEIAAEVVSYIKEMGYTHIELMPVTEYPLDESWGYQVTGYFAPTARYGTGEDFKYFVNHLHMHNIGVVFDFVAAHFPKDDSFLAQFDGSALYEDPHPVMGNHPQWGTLIFNYQSKQVVNFLLSYALFWIKEMHVDMIRVDAVESILYLDYQRKEGEYEKNHLGGVENYAGIAFLQKLNTTIKKRHPGVLVIAEDPSLYDGVTRPVELEGLGFSMKWNIGWAADLFTYLSLPDEKKSAHHSYLLNSYKEVFREKYLLVISHDDVSLGKKSLRGKFSEKESQQFAYLRLLYSVAICHPGKKLFFMGHEVGDDLEFNEKASWRKKPLTDHVQLKHKCFTKEMNHLYTQEKALFEIDFDQRGFSWIDYSDYRNSLISFIRKGVRDRILVIHNFSMNNMKNYLVAIPGLISIQEIMNTDNTRYGGDGHLNPSIDLHPKGRGVYLDIPKLSTVICKIVLDEKKYVL